MIDHRNTLAIENVLEEMKRQDAKWGGDRDQENFVWQTILTEEVGESAEECLNVAFAGKSEAHLYEEVVQVAAVALQWLENLDRKL
jgi:hypothetical protein